MNKSESNADYYRRIRESYREQGLVQIAVWVPADQKEAILKECADRREAHLQKARSNDAG